MVKEQPFLPILLGADMNAYGMARAFHDAYGIKSLVLARFQLTPVKDSSILTFQQINNLNSQDVFIVEMEKLAKQHPNKKLLLLACGDEYVKLIIKNKPALQQWFKIPYMDESLMDNVLLKENFYKMCDKYGFNYPQTTTVDVSNYETFEPPFEYPIIIKASNSVEYWNCSFPGKKKVFVAHDAAEKTAIFKAIYSSTYQDTLIIQEFIPGDDSHMRVLNAYVGKDGKVKLMCLGNPLLEEHTPEGIGSYAAVVTTYDKELMDQVRFFLEDIGYTGFANFDLKYDERDGQYKLFEINLRNGRSSYFVTASGHNLMKYVADDHIFNLDQKLTYVQNEHLWLIIPKGLLFKYVSNEQAIMKVKKLFREGKVTNSLFYSKDMNWKRWIRLQLNSYNYYSKYKKYFNNKGLS